MAKSDPPCSGFEFALRRAAAGLDNRTMIEISAAALTPLRKCSLSSLTKWNAGQLPVSRKAYAALVMIEEAIEDEVLNIIEKIEQHDPNGEEDIEIITPAPGWQYSQSTHAVAASRARTAAALLFGDRVRIRAEQIPATTTRFLHATRHPDAGATPNDQGIIKNRTNDISHGTHIELER
tara:strand:- start:19506 stop:20042 length:537 start_codon:yes stop_codon:yes gene_type:complete